MEFADRQSKNRNYSLRAFARDVDLSLTSVSLILKRKRKPSPKARKRLVEWLDLSPAYQQEMGYWVPSEEFVEHDKFKMTSEWVHWAILNLVREGAPPKSVQSLEKHLDLPASVVAASVDRLLRLGFIRKEGKHYVRNLDQVRTKDDVPATAYRKLHSEVLDVAKVALVNTPIDKREFSTSFMMIRPAHIGRVKDLIRKFRAEMADIFDSEASTTKDSKLHVIAVQMFPLEK